MVNRPGPHPLIRDRIPAPLPHAPVISSARSSDTDDFDARVRDVPSNFHTDGVFGRPGAALHHLRSYGVPPEPALVQHIVGKNVGIEEDARRSG